MVAGARLDQSADLARLRLQHRLFQLRILIEATLGQPVQIATPRLGSLILGLLLSQLDEIHAGLELVKDRLGCLLRLRVRAILRLDEDVADAELHLLRLRLIQRERARLVPDLPLQVLDEDLLARRLHPVGADLLADLLAQLRLILDLHPLLQVLLLEGFIGLVVALLLLDDRLYRLIDPLRQLLAPHLVPLAARGVQLQDAINLLVEKHVADRQLLGGAAHKGVGRFEHLADHRLEWLALDHLLIDFSDVSAAVRLGAHIGHRNEPEAEDQDNTQADEDPTGQVLKTIAKDRQRGDGRSGRYGAALALLADGGRLGRLLLWVWTNTVTIRHTECLPFPARSASTTAGRQRGISGSAGGKSGALVRRPATVLEIWKPPHSRP